MHEEGRRRRAFAGATAGAGAERTRRRTDPTAATAPPPPPPAAPEAAAPAAGPGGSITGKIELPAALAKTKPEGTLFLVARRISDNPTARGTLIAVKKMPATKFPLAFDLSAADMPFQNGAFDGELTLTARIDQDGDPLTHQKGDILGTLPKVRVGSKNVKVTMDQVQKETESLAGPGRNGRAADGAADDAAGASGAARRRCRRDTSWRLRWSRGSARPSRGAALWYVPRPWITGSSGTWSATA